MYDRSRKSADLRPGQLVLWHVQGQAVGTSKKLNPKWKGPFRVVDVARPRVQLADRNDKLKWIHINHVKPTPTQRPLSEFRERGRPRIQRGRCNGSSALPQP